MAPATARRCASRSASVVETSATWISTITITDPKTFTKPITFSVVEELLPDTDLLEHYCVENEKDDAHMPGRERK